MGSLALNPSYAHSARWNRCTTDETAAVFASATKYASMSPKTKRTGPAVAPPYPRRQAGEGRERGAGLAPVAFTRKCIPGGSYDHKTRIIFGSGGDCPRDCALAGIRRRATECPDGEHRGDRYRRRGARAERAGSRRVGHRRGHPPSDPDGQDPKGRP